MTCCTPTVVLVVRAIPVTPAQNRLQTAPVTELDQLEPGQTRDSSADAANTMPSLLPHKSLLNLLYCCCY